uniref:KAP family P-loop domain protein n=1 Tax=Eubacterium cellulosolvens (strain ATCC 43171 / JCM 9499 / 6) TaxID=633697 RepID=I5AWT4_EUBC6
MTSEEIINAVREYVRDDNAKYAIMIDGAWGSGKTYLYENYLAEEISRVENGKNERRPNVYISLYGMSNTESLAKQLLTNYMIYVKGNGSDFAKLGSKIAGGLSIVCSALSFSNGMVTLDPNEGIKKIIDQISVKNMVICFDDLERSAIPITEFLGFVNNLIEHCNCKVLILADEKNIGKINANTNLEEKYLTILSGYRKIVERLEDDEQTSRKRDRLGVHKNGEITVEELKKLNELVYSENYLYMDMKEKVIGKTLYYYPELKNAITELIKGSNKVDGLIQDEKYKDFLTNHLEMIENTFAEVKTRNLRIIRTWILAFRKIYDITKKNFSDNEYYEVMLDEFMHYSIWVVSSLKKNKKILYKANYRGQELVSFEDNEYSYTLKHDFIDAWIRRDVWDEADLNKVCKSIIERKQREKISNPTPKQSTGVELRKLATWKLMEDDEVRESCKNLENELDANKYAYCDYGIILAILLELSHIKLYKGDINRVRETMIKLIQKDEEVQEERVFHDYILSEEIKVEFRKVYKTVEDARRKRNTELTKVDHNESNIYENAETFFENCQKMKDYYSEHKSFLAYLDLEKLIELIKSSSVEDIHLKINKAFKTVYFMGNLKDFFIADIDDLQWIREQILDNGMLKECGITRRIAFESLAEIIKEELIALGVDEEQLKR